MKQYLDLLQDILGEYDGTVLLVSHDRYFLDNVAGWILELDRGHGIPWEGNYSSWLEQKEARLEQEEKQEQGRIKAMKEELEWVRQNPKGRQAKGKARLNAYQELLSQEPEAGGRIQIHVLEHRILAAVDEPPGMIAGAVPHDQDVAGLGLALEIVLKPDASGPPFLGVCLGSQRLARAIGGTVAGSFPWEDYETCLEETLAEKWDALMEEGVWVQNEVDTVADSVRLAGMNAEAVQAEGDVNSFPLLLVPFDSMRISSRTVGDTPFMIKTVADTVIKGTDGFVEINPRTAGDAGLKEGALATLTTPRGETRVRVHLFEGIKPGVIAMARGLGHTAYDDYLAGKGINVNELVGPVEDPSCGHDVAWGIRAKLAKA